MAWLRSVAVAAAAVVVLPLASVTTAGAALPAGSPAAVNGQLKVCGVQLCNKDGKAIQLRGMSTHGIQWYQQCAKSQWWDALQNDWKADIVRVAMYVAAKEGGYETNPRKFTDLMHSYIEEATKRGLYVLVDWHQLD
ncbi:MAG TPA: cellulase family glycosylhydrolase, partial [Lentzea sp.]